MKKAILCLSFFTLAMSHKITLAQGSLTPPGAPGPTMKTLDQLDAKLEKRTPISSIPLTINVPGSYYFTTNLKANGSITGIRIETNNVTIDLNGFALIGTNGSSQGINVVGGRTNIVLKNGAIRDWGSSAINGPNMRQSVIENILASQNAIGMLAGAECRVSHCTSVKNSGTGISVETNSIVSDCISSKNTGVGYYISTNSIVQRCIAADNLLDGFFLNPYCQALNNTATGNNQNFMAGFAVRGLWSRLEGNHIAHNYYGMLFYSGSTNIVVKNILAGNTFHTTGLNNQIYGPFISTNGVITNLNPWANFSY